ncbi:STT3 domain-containing protein [Maridesulfovibrio zosterae]|uniref:STT3 domain-containing protein n=1 Tax=Maridesulfovibrio zosterae TaxID=82171 RepID=UPI000408FD79|nr:STT3 domain-containing protein [Maridesulfovibrio zosterae]
MRQEFQKPAWMNNWKVFLLFSVISFSIAFGVRCFDLPKWDNPNFMVNGEYIMGTHDAYFWLAGAKGLGSAAANPMSVILRTLGGILNVPLGNIAFWLPAFFAGLTAVAAFGWGMLLGGRWVGLVSAVYSSLLPAYYFRTRLTYYDTDVVTLLFPLLISLLLAVWIIPFVSKSWKFVAGETENSPTIYDYSLPILAGLVAYWGCFWHQDIKAFSFTANLTAVFLALVLARGRSRTNAFRGIFIYLLVAYFGVLGGLFSIGLIYLFLSSKFLKLKKYESVTAYLVIFVLLLVVSGAGTQLYSFIGEKAFSYMKPVSESLEVSNTPSYPGIAQSVIEAQNISVDRFLLDVAGNSIVGWIGAFSLIICLCIRPTFLFLIPLVFATLAALKLGGRFAMFGGAPFGAGLGVAITYLLEKFVHEKKIKQMIPALVSLTLIVYFVSINLTLYKTAPVTPIITQQHATALIESGKIMKKGSTVWTWWDWGYATRYFTGQTPFADGGNHAGEVLYPLAFAFTTPSLMQSSQFVQYSAFHKNSPANYWKDMSAKKVNDILKSLGTKVTSFNVDTDQYFVVTWKDVMLSRWIMYYGAWNLQTSLSSHPTLYTLRRKFSVNFDSGVLAIDGSAPISLQSSDFIGTAGRDIRMYENAGMHLVYNKDLSQGILVDDVIYSSTLLQLLIGNPKSPDILNNYSLIFEGAPYVRVYKVVKH